MNSHRRILEPCVGAYRCLCFIGTGEIDGCSWPVCDIAPGGWCAHGGEAAITTVDPNSDKWREEMMQRSKASRTRSVSRFRRRWAYEIGRSVWKFRSVSQHAAFRL